VRSLSGRATALKFGECALCPSPRGPMERLRYLRSWGEVLEILAGRFKGGEGYRFMSFLIYLMEKQ
jgi:hypothetical protein